MPDDDFDLDAWRDQVVEDAERWRTVRQQYQMRRRLVETLKVAARPRGHPKWDDRYVELLLLISEANETAETPPIRRQLATRMGITQQSNDGRINALIDAGYIESFEHPHQLGRDYFRLTEQGRRFLVRTLGDGTEDRS